MAVAITDFSGFCGFLPVERIAEYLSTVPELVELVGRSIAEAFRAAVMQPQPTEESIRACLKDVFTRLMSANESDVKREAEALVARYQAGKVKATEEGIKDLTIELGRQYPGDVGIFCIFLLNVVNLKAGQAVFLKANEPHAYIHGGESSRVFKSRSRDDNALPCRHNGVHGYIRSVPFFASLK